MSLLFSTRIYISCAILIAAIFAVDLYLPLGIAAGVPYVSVILIALWSTNTRLAIYLAIICTAMTLLGLYFSPTGGELWKVLFNRALAVFAIWITAILVAQWKQHEAKLAALTSEVENEKKKIYVATLQGAQHINNNLLNQLQLVKLEVNKHDNFDKKTKEVFDDVLGEASSLMKKLATIEKIDEDVIRESTSPK